MKILRWIFWSLLCVGNLIATTPYKHHFLSLVTQNDAYVNPMVDEYYTAGHSLVYASSEGDYGWLNTFGLLEGETSFSLGLSQAIYAPKAKFDPLPPSDDHPYAGFLCLTFGIHHRQENMLESLGLRIGVSGRIAFGQEVQNGIHSLLNVGLLNGWGTQIGNEVIVDLHYEWIYKHSLYKSAYFSIDVLPFVEFALGNANIYGRVNATLRMGYNLENTFLPQGVIGENMGLQNGRVYADGIGFFVFVGIGGGYVARKMAIDGNFFGKDGYPRGAELVNWVGNLHAGVSFVSGDLSLSYMMIYTSKEFVEQKNAHAVGSISLSYSF